MNVKTVLTLLKKEIVDIFRDTKTIIIMIIVPLVLYPLIFLASMLLTSSIMKEATVKTYNVAIVSESKENYDLTDKLLKDALEKHKYHFDVSEYDGEEDYEKSIRSDKYQGIIIVKDSGEEYPDFEIYTITSSNKSSTCRSMIKQVLADYEDEIIEQKLKNSIDNYDELTEKPFKIDYKDYSSKEETTGMLIGYIMPFMMIISVLMGAFTVAIDVSVGEKERGTLETLITLPISNAEMMISKFLAVSAFALFSVSINLLSFLFMGIYVYNSMALAKTMMGGFKFTQFIPSIILMTIVLVLFSFFVSAVCLCFDFTAKSVKEANNMTTPLMLVLMTGAGMSVIPGIKLTFFKALIPILNVSLLIKDLFMLKFDPYMIAVVFFSTFIHTMLAIFIMTKIFSSEDILFGEGVRSVKVFEKRANMKDKQIPEIGDILFVFAIMFLTMSFAGGYVVLKFGFAGYAVTQLIIFAVPVAYAWYMKTDFKNVFSLKAPRVNEMIGAVLFCLGSYIINTLLVSVLIKYIPSLATNNEDLSGIVTSGGFIASLFVVGVMPAFAEEAAFRGFLYGTLKNKKIPILATMIITAVVFAAYHMNLLQFIYVTVMGMIMSYMIYNSKSIFVTVLFHLLNNSFSVVLQFHPEVFEKIPFFSQTEFSTKEQIIILIIGLAILAVAFFVSDNKIGLFKKKSKNNEV